MAPSTALPFISAKNTLRGGRLRPAGDGGGTPPALWPARPRGSKLTACGRHRPLCQITAGTRHSTGGGDTKAHVRPAPKISTFAIGGTAPSAPSADVNSVQTCRSRFGFSTTVTR